jgi:hypothetical protein
MIPRINEEFASLDQMVKSKEYSELIDEINNLEPRDITPTKKSELHYNQRCRELIRDFQENLI